ncbi:FAD synthetase family protein [Treponema parvum]|uniref:FAD synthetase family protein n=1 Tax=Treponema parvum TaxID=138851 RepID=UPI001AEBADB8|nr:FAD synthetase family protein [Treponema parvum]QTQ15876.1 FAD synthetase family protein [Treponema parvum]
MTVITWNDVLKMIEGKSPPPDFFNAGCGTAVSVGSFDGPHIGHKKLFEALLSRKKEGLAPGVLTFTRPLAGYKNPEEYQGDISTLSQRLSAFENAGLGFAVVIDFSDDFSKIEGRVFLSLLQRYLNMKFLAEGEDFRCGYRGATGIGDICKYAAESGYAATAVPPVLYGNEKVSSSRIRQSILDGDFISVEYMLSAPYKVDCADIKWRVEKKEDTVFLFASKPAVQALPAKGTYDVKLMLCSGQDGCRAKFISEPHSLRLEIPTSKKISAVRTMEFIV